MRRYTLRWTNGEWVLTDHRRMHSWHAQSRIGALLLWATDW